MALRSQSIGLQGRMDLSFSYVTLLAIPLLQTERRMKLLSLLMTSVVLVGCATSPVPVYMEPPTFSTTTAGVKAYAQCAVANAWPMVNAPDSAVEVANVAVSLCDGKMRELLELAQRENSDKPAGAIAAATYIKKVKDEITTRLAADVLVQRSKKALQSKRQDEERRG
jgi:hypothetical protein